MGNIKVNCQGPLRCFRKSPKVITILPTLGKVGLAFAPAGAFEHIAPTPTARNDRGRKQGWNWKAQPDLLLEPAIDKLATKKCIPPKYLVIKPASTLHVLTTGRRKRKQEGRVCSELAADCTI